MSIKNSAGAVFGSSGAAVGARAGLLVLIVVDAVCGAGSPAQQGRTNSDFRLKQASRH